MEKELSEPGNQIEIIRRRLKILKHHLAEIPSANISCDLDKSLTSLDNNLNLLSNISTSDSQAADKQRLNDILVKLIPGLTETFDAINESLQELLKLSNIEEESRQLQDEDVEEIDSRLEDLDDALQHFTYVLHFLNRSIQKRKSEPQDLDLKYAEAEKSVQTACNRLFTGIRPAYYSPSSSAPPVVSSEESRKAGISIQKQLQQNFEESIVPRAWPLGVHHCVHWLETARWLKKMCKPDESPRAPSLTRQNSFGPELYCLFHLFKSAYILLETNKYDRTGHLSEEVYGLVHTIYIDILEELGDVYASFSVDLEYSVFLTMETLFHVALPASWPFPKKLSLLHISIDSSSSGNHSPHSSYLSHSSSSPKKRQFYESMPSSSAETDRDDKTSPLNVTESNDQGSGKGKAPILQKLDSEDLIVNSENGEEWFSCVEIRISIDVDQGEWEKCRLKIFRQNEVIYSGPTIRVHMEKANGETVDELVDINSTELIPTYQFSKYYKHDTGDILLYSTLKPRKLQYRFDKSNVEDLEIYGFQGALTNTYFEGEYQVEGVYFKPKIRPSDAVYGSDIKIQIWDDAPSLIKGVATFSQPESPVSAASQSEKDINLTDLRSLRLLFFVQNKIYLLHISDNVLLTSPKQSKDQGDSKSSTIVMLSPSSKDVKRAVRVRCISGDVEHGPGIPLNFWGCRFTDQTRDDLFSSYDSITMNFYDETACKDFIMTLNQLVTKWKSRKQRLIDDTTRKIDQQHKIIVQTRGKIVLEERRKTSL